MMNQFDWHGLGHGVDPLRLVRKNWKRVEVAGLASILQPPPTDLTLLQTFALAPRAPDCKDHDLPVLDAFGLTQAVYFSIFELDRQNIPAHCKLRGRDYQNENPGRL
jgi:hypothetical protein